MGYATLTHLIDRFGEQELIQLSDREGSGVVDQGVVSVALAEADAEIDSYLFGIYALPVQTTPPVLVRVACDIVRYRLATDTPLEEVRTRYEDARRWLERLASRQTLLDLPAAPASIALGGILFSSAPSIFDGLCGGRF